MRADGGLYGCFKRAWQIVHLNDYFARRGVPTSRSVADDGVPRISHAGDYFRVLSHHLARYDGGGVCDYSNPVERDIEKKGEFVVEDLDWRLTTYNDEWNGKTFELKTFKTEGRNDHEHCEFCWQKITDLPIEDVDREGYVYEDFEIGRSVWICKQCFADFKEKFDFKTK